MHVAIFEGHHVFKHQRHKLFRQLLAWLIESILLAAEHARFKSQHHAIALALIALVQVDIVVQILLPELLLLLLLSYFFLELQFGFIFGALMPCKLRICHLGVEF